MSSKLKCAYTRQTPETPCVAVNLLTLHPSLILLAQSPQPLRLTTSTRKLATRTSSWTGLIIPGSRTVIPSSHLMISSSMHLGHSQLMLQDAVCQSVTHPLVPRKVCKFVCIVTYPTLRNQCHHINQHPTSLASIIVVVVRISIPTCSLRYQQAWNGSRKFSSSG